MDNVLICSPNQTWPTGQMTTQMFVLLHIYVYIHLLTKLHQTSFLADQLCTLTDDFGFLVK